MNKKNILKVYNLTDKEFELLDQMAQLISVKEKRVVTRSKLVAEHLRATLLKGAQND